MIPQLKPRQIVLLGISAACVVEMVPGVPGLLTTAAGLWLLIGAPVAVWYGTAARAVSRRDSALLLSLGLAVITDMVVALGVNTVLPWFGQAHPLTTIALGGGAALVLIALGAFLPQAGWDQPWRGAAGRRPRGLAPVGSLGALCLLLSVAGPIRLNNGFSGAVSCAALVAIAGLLVLLLVRRRQYPEAVLQTGLYIAAAGLLLLNSLRGWFITGHDIQREYEYFRLTLGGSLWNVHAYPNPYNACLSITLFPVDLYRLTAIPDLYVFKAVLPLLFAATPVLVYRSVRNVAPQLVALLSAMFFLAFPTFFTDMTFLGRQEIAFLLLGCAMVVLTDSGRALGRRRLMFLALAVGIVLSHYSTGYMVVATLAVGFGADLVWRLLALRGRRRPRRRTRSDHGPSFVSWWMVAATAVLALGWAGPVTHTSGQLRTTLSDAVQQVLHFGQGQSGSSDTAYSLFGGAQVSPQQRMDQFQGQIEQQTAAKRAAGDYLPLRVVQQYATPVVAQQELPPTSLGRLLDAVGINVSTVNGLLRQGAAALMQILLLVGLVVTVRARRRVFRPSRDQVTLTVGAVGGLVLVTIVPQLSVDYSVLRAFQQGLLFFAPFLAAGTLWALRWAGRRTVPLTCALIATLFLDLTGVVPTVLGGYPAQLQLSNSGQYYDLYYSNESERVAASRLMQQLETTRTPNGGMPVVQAESFTFNRLQTVLTGPVVGNIYPTVIGTDTYVFLGATTVRTGQVSVSYQGDRITYRYPVALLNTYKNEIYSSEGAEIYR
ncbi:DUF2206 domain-containing protein [Streptacidiphilus fuscans]|uniref:DUF2206 domain-containing protein n=1 Tax=Streptacidiphilus fuscans TaxID=2789292 RepID=A0A931FFC5_9ACTN|nr:DUF2206 domain-containing protein [Streptacidiphilus fuscans]MBF9068284.1 DUF2206 domain-containing protein [Streptacidiphilus fuscans]